MSGLSCEELLLKQALQRHSVIKSCPRGMNQPIPAVVLPSALQVPCATSVSCYRETWEIQSHSVKFSSCSECSSTLIISFENALSKVKSRWRKTIKLREQREALFVTHWKAEQFQLFLKVCWCCWWFLATLVFCILQSNQGDLGVVYRGLFLPASCNSAKYTCGRV